MIMFAILATYFTMSAITLYLCIRMRPYWFYTYFLDSMGHTDDCKHWNGCGRTHHGCKSCEKIVSGLTGEEGSQAYYLGKGNDSLVFCALFWWIWIFALLFNMLSTATRAGVNSGLSTRAELNKELTELKKEIDALRNDKE